MWKLIWWRGVLLAGMVLCIELPGGVAAPALATEPTGKTDIILFSEPKDRTAEALDKLGLTYDYYDPASFAAMELDPYRLVIFSEESLESRCDRTPINEHAAKMQAFVHGGGEVLCLRVDSSRDEWFPPELAIEKATGYFRDPVVVDPEHPTLRSPYNLIDSRFPFYDPPMDPARRILDMIPWGGGIYFPYCNPSEAWHPVLAGGEEYADYPSDHAGPHYGLLVGRYGEGEVVLCQMVPILSFVDNRTPDAGRKLLQNLLEYCGAKTTWDK
jgi:hypothetical protein